MDLMSRGKLWFLGYLYSKEDLLFRVLYDKVHRPQLFTYATQHANYKMPHPVTGEHAEASKE